MLPVTDQGLVLHARADGPVDAPAVLLLNSLGTDLRMWDDVVEDLARDWRVLRFDKPGHGLSQKAAGPLGIADLGRMALAVMTAAGVPRAHVVGLSIGGQIAMDIARRAPERLDRLVLSNTAARIGTAEAWRARIAAVAETGLHAMAPGVMERWFSARWRSEHPARLALWQTMLARTDAQGYAACCEALAASDLTDACASITAPTLVIAGAEDGATPPDLVRGMADLIPGVRYVLMEGAGHLPCVEDPGAYAALLRAHLG